MRKIYKKYDVAPVEVLDCFSEIIMEEQSRPRPMRSYKPCKKTKNGSDKFWDTHQEHYETRAKRSGGRVARVKRHNAAHPKLIDELYKRSSIAKITTSQSKKPSKCYRTCKNCRSISRTKSKCKLNRINKPRKVGNNFKTIASQCAYVLVKNKKIGAEAGILKIESKLNLDVEVRAKPPKTASSGESQPQSKSQLSMRKPDTSIATMSSYNSYESLDQEPMV